MFDTNQFYGQCNSGEAVDCTKVYQYLRSFKQIILWGGSYLGAAVGRNILHANIKITKYWDVRADKLKTVNGISVELPFASEYDRDTTLIVYCIGNHTIRTPLVKDILAHGYQYLRGDIFYSGAICKFKNGMKLTSEQCWASMECRPLVCERAASIIKNQNRDEKPGERIDFVYIAFIVNNICNLSCKYCFQR